MTALLTGKKHFLTAIVGLCLFSLFFTDPIFQHPPLWLKPLLDLGHILFFGVFSFVFLKYVNLTKAHHQLLSVLLLSLILGTAIEFLQIYSNRYFEWQDIRKDVVGGLCGFVYYRWLIKPVARGLKWLSVGLALLVLIEIKPLALWLYDHYRIYTQLPVLADFEHERDIERWRADNVISLSSEQAFSGKQSLKVELSVESYSGATCLSLFSNWSDYAAIEFNLFNPEQEPLTVTIKITDKVHDLGEQAYSDRFNHRVKLENGWNTIKLPLDLIAMSPKNRTLDLQQISRLQIFTSQLKRPRLLYIDHITLIKGE